MSSVILLPVDFSDVTARLVDEAVRLARAMNLAVRLVHVSPPRAHYLVGADVGIEMLDKAMDDDRHAAREHLHQLEQTLADAGVEVAVDLLVGPPARTLIDEAARLRPVMILLGSHGHGVVHHLVMGSVTEALLKHAACPVLIVPARAPVPAPGIAAAALP